MSLLVRLTVHDAAEQSFRATSLTPIGLATDAVVTEAPVLADAGTGERPSLFDDLDEFVPFDLEPPALYVREGQRWLPPPSHVDLVPVDRNERCSADDIARTSAFGWLDVPRAVLEPLRDSLFEDGGIPLDVAPVPVLSTASWAFAAAARRSLRGTFAAPRLAGVRCRCKLHDIPPPCPYN